MRGLLATGAGTLIAMTLSACYGAPEVDDDGDGYSSWQDCNDMNAQIYPGAPDPFGDGIDQDCDGADGDGTQDAGGADGGVPDGG